MKKKVLAKRELKLEKQQIEMKIEKRKRAKTAFREKN